MPIVNIKVEITIYEITSTLKLSQEPRSRYYRPLSEKSYICFEFFFRSFKIPICMFHYFICESIVRVWESCVKTMMNYRHYIGVNFINILLARFSNQKCFFCQNVTREKHFCTKNARVKSWWNWCKHCSMEV